MSRNDERELIYFDENNSLSPEEIELSFIHDDLKGLRDIKEIDYDVQIDNLDYDGLSKHVKNYYEDKTGINSDDKICDEKEIVDCLYDGGVYKFSDFYKLKLVNVCHAGFGLVPDRYMTKGSDKKVERFKLINDFIDEINRTIDTEVSKEVKEEEKWKDQIEVNVSKFDAVQCENRIGIAPLRRLRRKINRLQKRYYQLYFKKRRKLFSKKERSVHPDRIINLYWDLAKFEEEYFSSKYCLNVTRKYKSRKFSDTSVHFGNIDEIKRASKRIIIKVDLYGKYIAKLFSEIKDWKIRRATDVYLIDSSKIKKDFINDISKNNPEYYREFNINELFNFFRDSTITMLNEHIEKDIRRRVLIDKIVQYTPYYIGGFLMILTFILQISYNYSVLKERWQRETLYIIYGIILGFAVITLINLLRNAVEFKRPKREKASRKALKIFMVFSFMAFSLHLYYLYRYDGYNDTYYYVDCKDKTIKLDGLRNRSINDYVIPTSIDNKNVSEITKLVFSNRSFLHTVTGDVTNIKIDDKAFKNSKELITVNLKGFKNVSKKCFYGDIDLTNVFNVDFRIIDKSAFDGCVNLTAVNLSNVTYLGKRAFANCKKIKNIEFSDDLHTIPNEAFLNCNNLYYNELPANLKTIEKSAFKGCASISSLVSNNVSKIGKDAFDGCISVNNILIKDISICYKKNLLDIFGETGLSNVVNLSIGKYPNVEDDLLLNNKHIEYVELGGVEKIGSQAFRNCMYLSTIKISGNVKSIGKAAFASDAALTNLSINFSSDYKKIEEETFRDCTKLANFTIPSSVTKIGANAFRNCDSLTSVTIPSNVKLIDEYCFYDANCISTINIESKDIKFKENAFSGCNKITSFITVTVDGYTLSGLLSNSYNKVLTTVIVNDVTSIPNEFFKGCACLSNVGIPNVTKVGASAFENCGSLETLDRIEYLSSIGSKAFYGCSRLTNVKFGTGITTISSEAFRNCNSLTSLVIPSNITKVGASAFENCINITSVDVKSTKINFEGNVFFNCPQVNSLTLFSVDGITMKSLLPSSYEKSLVTLNLASTITSLPDNFCENCKVLSDVTSNSITKIGASAFKCCMKLEVFKSDKALTSIGSEAFSNCTSLKSVDCKLPNIIPNQAFNSCTSLIESGIHNDVTSIGAYAYYGCVSLSDISFGDKLTSIGKGAFENINSIDTITISKINSDMKLYEIFGSNVNNLTTFDIKDATSIPDEFFMNCTNLLSIIHSKDITKIGAKAFKNCSKFSDFSIMEKAEEIGSEAFSNCSMITTLSLSSFVKKIGKDAFSGCNINSLICYQHNSSDTIVNIIGSEYISSLTTIQLYNLSTINDNFFNECTNLTTINLMNSVSKIGSKAFYDCRSLNTLIYSGTITEIGDYAFYNCEKLNVEKIVNSAVKIGKNAFERCSELTTVDLSSIKEIGDNAFLDCNYIRNITITNSNVKIGKTIFSGCINVTNAKLVFASTDSINNYFENDGNYDITSLEFSDRSNVPDGYFKNTKWLKEFDFTKYTSIGKYSFENTKLTEANMDNATTIGEGAFKDCLRLKSVSIKSCANLSTDLFKGCTNLIEVNNLKDYVTINTGAFENCTALSSITLDNVKKVCKNAFVNCNKIVNFTLNYNSLQLEEKAFSGITNIYTLTISAMYNDGKIVDLSKYFEKDGLNNVTKLTLLNVSTLSDKPLNNFDELKYIEIQGTVQKIPAKFLKDKANLVSVKLPNSIKEISNSAFENCPKLSEINVPTSLTSIGDLAFSGCTELKTFTLNKNMTYLGDSLFAGNAGLTLENAEIENQLHKDDWDTTWNSRTAKPSMSDAEITSVIVAVCVIVVIVIVGFTVVIIQKKKRQKGGLE